MKNDIDSILESMFRGGRLHFKSAPPVRNTAPGSLKHAQPLADPPSRKEDPTAGGGRAEGAPQPLDAAEGGLAEASARLADAGNALAAAEQAGGGLSQSLQESIQRLTQEARADMADLQRRLEEDGAAGQSAGNGGAPASLDAAFETARVETACKVLGQDEFVAALALAFKRPFVAGSDQKAPLCRAALLGARGTGRHSAVRAMTASLARQGVLKSPKAAAIDLSAYHAAGMEKLFVQDLYAALKGGASALLFESYEKCHPSVLSMVSALFREGVAPLPGRYVEQKGILADIGTALAPGAVSSLPVGGKYLFLVTEQSEARLGDAFGGPFLASLDDLLSTGPFTQESLGQIARQALDELCQRAQKQLGFTLTYGQEAADALAASFTPAQGAGALGRGADRLYRALSEEKLRKALPTPQRGEIAAKGGGLRVTYTHNGLEHVVSPGMEGEASQAALEQVKGELSGIVGLGAVKDYILSLEDNFKIQQLRRARGLKADSPSMHMIFTGNPGTGKTTVARIVSRYLKAIGLLSGGQLVEVTRADLVGQYVGHTAPLTQKAIQAALGGVLFIDEAYALYRGKDDSFGLEAIDTLVKGMEDHRESLVVILAGYSQEMEEFLTANSGLRSRFPHIIPFPDYTPEELWEITKGIVQGKGYRLDPACQAPLTARYAAMAQAGDARMNGNGRMARNQVEQAVIACSRRNVKEPEDTRDLELLIPQDFGL